MSRNAPLLIRALWALTWAFPQRRRVVRFWHYLDNAEWFTAARWAAFYVCRPRLWLEVRRHRAAMRTGHTITEA